MQKDNTTFTQKAALRRALLREIDDPVILETHGGIGALYRACYSHIRQGVVFEKDAAKTVLLAGQRPTWAVYEADAVAAMSAGAGAHLAVSVLDVDPYGDPWPVIRAFFTSERPRVARLGLAVNDGLRQKVRLGGAWSTESLRGVVGRFGNDLYGRYLDVCQHLVREHAETAGYTLRRFGGYYCGAMQNMTHYAAVLEQA